MDRPAVGAGRWGVVGLLKHFAAGGVGGVLNVFAGHPLDTIKVEACTIHTSLSGSRDYIIHVHSGKVPSIHGKPGLNVRQTYMIV